MAKHTIQFSDGSIFETTDEEMTKVARVIIPFSIIEESIKSNGTNPSLQNV